MNDNDLRSLAEKATPGPRSWEHEWFEDVEQTDRPDPGWTDHGPNLASDAECIIAAWGHDAWGLRINKADAEFIAACSTDRITSLLDRLAEAEAILNDLVREAKHFDSDHTRIELWHLAAKAEITLVAWKGDKP